MLMLSSTTNHISQMAAWSFRAKYGLLGVAQQVCEADRSVLLTQHCCLDTLCAQLKPGFGYCIL